MIKLLVLIASFNGNTFAIDHDLTTEDCAAYQHVLQESNPAQVEYTCEVQEG